LFFFFSPRVFNQQEEEFLGSFNAKDSVVLDLTKKQSPAAAAAAAAAASSPSAVSAASPAASTAADGTDTVSDALAKLSALSQSGAYS